MTNFLKNIKYALLHIKVNTSSNNLNIIYHLVIVFESLYVTSLLYYFLLTSLQCLDHSHTEVLIPQIYTGDPITCAIFIPAWDSNKGSSSFPRNQNKPRFIRWVCHLHLLRSERVDKTCVKCCKARKDRGRISFVFVFPAWSAKTIRPPICAPWLTTPLHGEVYEVWISLVYVWLKNCLWIQLRMKIIQNLQLYEAKTISVTFFPYLNKDYSRWGMERLCFFWNRHLRTWKQLTNIFLYNIKWNENNSLIITVQKYNIFKLYSISQLPS